MALSETCGNCAHGCQLHPKNVKLQNQIFCTYWVETELYHHSCIKFITHEEAKFVHYQDYNSTIIMRFPYPLTKKPTFNDFTIIDDLFALD